MAVKKIFAGLPWWVKWVAAPILAVVVFGGLITSVIGFVIGLFLKTVAFLALIIGLVCLVRKFGTSSSRDDW